MERKKIVRKLRKGEKTIKRKTRFACENSDTSREKISII